MSLVIGVARAQQQGTQLRQRGRPGMGDPGLWGFLGRTARTALGALTGVPRTAAPAAPVGAIPLAPPRTMPGRPGRTNGGQVRPAPGFTGFMQRMVPGGQTGYETLGCGSGFHPNKTSYHLKDGSFVDVGTRCVRNRRRNPMNARALSRAIGRVDSGKRLQNRLSEISTGKYTAAGKRKKCD